MKMPAALLVSALLLLAANSWAGGTTSDLKASFIAGDLGFNVTNDSLVRGGIAFCGSDREVTFMAVSCKASHLAISRDTITCHVAGQYAPAYPSAVGELVFFSISKGRDEARWQALCSDFQAWTWSGAGTLSIRCKRWCVRVDNGLLMFHDTDSIGIGSEQPNLTEVVFPGKMLRVSARPLDAAVVDEILRQRTPVLAMGGSMGWRTR